MQAGPGQRSEFLQPGGEQSVSLAAACDCLCDAASISRDGAGGHQMGAIDICRNPVASIEGGGPTGSAQNAGEASYGLCHRRDAWRGVAKRGGGWCWIGIAKPAEAGPSALENRERVWSGVPKKLGISTPSRSTVAKSKPTAANSKFCLAPTQTWCLMNNSG